MVKAVHFATENETFDEVRSQCRGIIRNELWIPSHADIIHRHCQIRLINAFEWQLQHVREKYSVVVVIRELPTETENLFLIIAFWNGVCGDRPCRRMLLWRCHHHSPTNRFTEHIMASNSVCVNATINSRFMKIWLLWAA